MPEGVRNLMHTVAELTKKLPHGFAVFPSCTTNAGPTQRGYPEEEIWEVPGQQVTTWDGDRCHQWSQRQDLEHGSGGQSPHEATQCHQAQSPPHSWRAAGPGREKGRLNPNTTTACPKSLQKQHCSTERPMPEPCELLRTRRVSPQPRPVTHSSVPAAPRPSPGSRTGWALAAWWGARTGAAAPRRRTVGHKYSWVRQGTHTSGKNLRAKRATETGPERAPHESHRSLPSPATAEKANSFIPVSQTGNREIKWLVST